MKHLFIPYELAVIAKEKGFDEVCVAHWKWSPKLSQGILYTLKFSCSDETNKHRLQAPLYQQIVDWFREKYEIDVFVKRAMKKPHKAFIGVIIDRNGLEHNIYPNNYKSVEDSGTYYESINKAIEEAFKLI